MTALLLLGFAANAGGQIAVRPGQRPRIHLGAPGPLPKEPENIDITGATSLASDAAGNLYLGSIGSGRVLRIDAATRQVTYVVRGRRGPTSGAPAPALDAVLRSSLGLACNAAGDLFIADAADNRIRKLAAGTGTITTIAGTGRAGFSGDGGPATAAELRYPSSLAVALSGDLYVADSLNQRVRKIAAGTGIITTVAGGPGRGFSHTDVPGTEAMLQYPTGLAADAAGNIYFADSFNNRIWKLDPRSGRLTTAVGSGASTYDFAAVAGWGEPPDQSILIHPSAVSVDAAGNLYIVDAGSRRLLRVDAATRTVGTITEFDGGPGGQSPLLNPNTIVVDPAGRLYQTDHTTYKFGVTFMLPALIQDRLAFYARRAAAERPAVARRDALVTIAGNEFPWPLFGFTGDGGQAGAAQIGVSCEAIDGAGNLYFAEPDQRIRRIDAATGVITTVAGNGTPGFSGDGGPATAAQLQNPAALAVDRAGDIFISDLTNGRIRRVDAKTGLIATVAGPGHPSGDQGPVGRPGTAVSGWNPMTIAVDEAGNLFLSLYCLVIRIDARTNLVSAYAGTGQQGFGGDGGPATAAPLATLASFLTCGGDGNLYLLDGWEIRRVDARTHIITAVAGRPHGGGAPPADGAVATEANVSAFSGQFTADRAGNLWLTLNYALFEVDAATGRLRRFMPIDLDHDGGCLVADGRGDLFVAGGPHIREIPASALGLEASAGAPVAAAGAR